MVDTELWLVTILRSSFLPLWWIVKYDEVSLYDDETKYFLISSQGSPRQSWKNDSNLSSF